MASRLGAALAPIMVIPIQQAYGWRMSFFVFGVFGLLWGLGWYLWFRNTPAEKSGVSEEERRTVLSETVRELKAALREKWVVPRR